MTAMSKKPSMQHVKVKRHRYAPHIEAVIRKAKPWPRLLTRSEMRVMGSVYLSTDCRNEVYDYATLHHKQEPIAERLEAAGLLTHVDNCVKVDGNGAIGQSWREGRGWRLTQLGYESLTHTDADRWPGDGAHRRFGRGAASPSSESEAT